MDDAKGQTDEEILPLAKALLQIRRSIEDANARRNEDDTPTFVATSIELELQIVATNEKTSEGKGDLNFSVLGMGFKGGGKKSAKSTEDHTHLLRIKFCPIIGDNEDGNYTILNGNQELKIAGSSPLVTIQLSGNLGAQTGIYVGSEASGANTGAASTNALPSSKMD